jgi:predicted enzyme related to lactoylglutathione lyase
MLAAMPQSSIGLVLDCTNPAELARFWADALELEIAGEWGAYTVLISPSGSRPKLLLQRVSEAKSSKNRMHLDIEVADVDAEVARLEGIGARRAEDSARTEFGMRWTVLLDPEGNEFCVCDGGQGSC